MKILVTGATGTIGKELCSKLSTHQLIVFTRNTQTAKRTLSSNFEYVDSLDLVDFNELDAVINLAGEPIAEKRWTNKQKELIKASRVNVTSYISRKILEADSPPSVFISGSAIGYYGRQPSSLAVTESFTECNPEFSHTLCNAWESAALLSDSKTRVCVLRTGIVLSQTGGALSKLLPTFRLGLGSIVGSGQQMMSWIHIDDMTNGIIHLLTNEDCRGSYNFTAPNPATNMEFSKTLAKTLKKPCFLKMPSGVMTLLFGEMSELLLFGQNVLPKKLQESGFEFRFPNLTGALDDLLKS